MKLNRIFSDINPNMIAHPATKQLVKQFDVQSINFSIKNLIMTNFYDAPFQPNKGSSVRALLFENMTTIVEDSIERAIKLCIGLYEPRVFIVDVIVVGKPDINIYDISITYKILNQEAPYTVELVLNRIK